MKIIELTIENLQQPLRIDKYISESMDNISRNRVQQLIKEGLVCINSKLVKRVGEKVKPGDRLIIQIPPPKPDVVLPEPIDLEILYEDEHIVGINKPAGLTVHPTERIKTGTLVNALLYHVKNLSGIGGVLRPGIVHRLDRVTSGVLVAAKHDEAHRCLCEQFKSRRIQKTYLAIVHGSMAKTTGIVDLPIGRHPTDRKRMAILPDGRKSVTRYKILRTGLGGSLVEVYPLTGRTHQIRVHLKHLGIPIVADSVYTLKKYIGRGELERWFETYPGIALHARRLCFEHPVDKREIRLVAPLPERFGIIQEMYP
jgi:23S rRNA pseudouridine1911/1915/1917 synthase